MIEFTYRYPNDPPAKAVLMFGMEFSQELRRGPVPFAFINGVPTEQLLQADEIICDLCNAEVEQFDPLLFLDYGYAYCKDCVVEKLEFCSKPRVLSLEELARRYG